MMTINTEGNIKNNLPKYRKWKHITQADLAKELKISTQLLRMIECDDHYPKYQVRASICKYFDVSQDQMFYIAEED